MAFFAQQRQGRLERVGVPQRRPIGSRGRRAQHPSWSRRSSWSACSYHRCNMIERRRERRTRQALAHEGRPDEDRDGAVEPRRDLLPRRQGRRREAVLGQRDQGERQAGRRAHQHRVARARADAQDRRQGREVEEARGGRAVQPVERARRRLRERRGLHGVRPGLHGGLAEEQEPPRPREARCSTRARSATRSTRRSRTRTACYYMHRSALLAGAAALPGGGRSSTRSSSRRG